MANVLFTRTSDPNSKPVTDGQLIFDTSGNGKMYLDNGTNRLEMGGALTVDATLSKTSTNPVQNKAVAGVMLDSLSDIGNVTSKGFLTDALAVKQLNTNVNELNNSFISNIYVGNDGKLHKVQGGADSVLPFSSGINPIGGVTTKQTGSFASYTADEDGLYIAISQSASGSNDRSCYFTSNSSTVILSRNLDKASGYGGYVHTYLMVVMLKKGEKITPSGHNSNNCTYMRVNDK